MTETTSEIAAGVSAAVTGPDTPNQMTISRPAREALSGLAGISVAVILIGMLAIVDLSWWGRWTVLTEPDRASKVGWMGLVSLGSLLIIVIAYATSKLNRIDATVGGAHINVEGALAKDGQGQ